MIGACEMADQENRGLGPAMSLRAASGSVAVVVAKQTSEPCLAWNVFRHAGVNGRVRSAPGRGVAQPLMRPEVVVVQGIGLHDVIQLPQAKAVEVVKALAFVASDPGLDEAVRDESTWRGQHGPSVFAAEVVVESLGEVAVAVVEEEPNVDPLVSCPHRGIPGLLPHPLGGWAVGVLRTPR